MSPQPLLLELDGSITSSVTEVLEWFDWAKKAMSVTTPTSIVLRHIYFNSAIQTAALSLLGAPHGTNRREEKEEESFSTASSSSKFENLTLSCCFENDESPLLEEFVMEAVRLDVFRSITFQGSERFKVRCVPMKVFDLRRGGFPSRLDRLVLHSVELTHEDFGFLAGALGNNCGGNGKGERHEYGLHHLTIQKVRMPTIRNFCRNKFAFLCDGLRRNKSLRSVEVLHFEEDFCWLPVLESLSENNQLTLIHLAINRLEKWAKEMESCHNLVLAKNLQTLHLSFWAQNEHWIHLNIDRVQFLKSLSTNAMATARHVLQLMMAHPRLSHVWIDRIACMGGTQLFVSDISVTYVPYVCNIIPPELDHQIRHMADLNYAGRSLLIMQEEGESSTEVTGAGTARTGSVPMGLWPLVLERALQKPWPFSTNPSQLDTVGWVPINRFNGIYHLLRFGPALLHRGPSNDAPP